MQTCIWPSWCHCHSLSLASVKSRLVLPFWYRLIWVVLENGPLYGCVCVWILKIAPHLAYVATLPCGTLMPTKQAIYDKLQGSVATYLRYGGVVNDHIKKGLRVEKKIKIGEYLAKLQARAWLSHALCAPGQHTAKRRRKCTRLPRSCLQICQIFTDLKMSLSDSAINLFYLVVNNVHNSYLRRLESSVLSTTSPGHDKVVHDKQ